MQMTEEGLALIRHFEGFRGAAYRCPGGVWTIGYGHTAMAGPPGVAQGMLMTEPSAEALLKADAGRFAEQVKASLTRDLSDQQFAALVSFAYNVGITAFRGSSVLKAVNAGDFDSVPRRLQMWVKGGGRVLPGLVKRRAAEADLFMTASAGSIGTGIAETGQPEVTAGPSAARSTTLIAAAIAAIAALLSGGLGAFAAGGVIIVALAAICLTALAWIVRERLRKIWEEGV